MGPGRRVLGGSRGRRISAPDRRGAVELIDEAVAAGATRKKACEELRLSLRTYRRWRVGEAVKEDGRPGTERPAPANKRSEQERETILQTCNEPAYCRLPPSQIVPRLADESIYLGSESSFYRILREADQLHHRGRSQAPRKLSKPQGYKASGPNQVWSWDITYLAATMLGMFYRLYSHLI